MHVRKGDTVTVIAGKDRGKRGKILRSIPDKNRVVVEGVNLQKRHLKPSMSNQGGIVTREGAIHVSNVMLYCPKCKAPRRARNRVEEAGKVRACKECGHEFTERG